MSMQAENLFDSPFEVTLFYTETVNLIRRIAALFEIHSAFAEVLQNTEPADVPGLDRVFERRLAGYILDELDVDLISKDMVLSTCNKLCKSTISWAYNMFPVESEPESLKNSYPIMMVANMCKIPHFYSRILGESVKQIISLRQTYPGFLPSELYNIIEGMVPLTGSPKSPLTAMELKALRDYLGSRKNIYVHMYLNSAFELSQQFNMLRQRDLTEAELTTLCKSSWLFLFLSGAVRNYTRTILFHETFSQEYFNSNEQESNEQESNGQESSDEPLQVELLQEPSELLDELLQEPSELLDELYM